MSEKLSNGLKIIIIVVACVIPLDAFMGWAMSTFAHTSRKETIIDVILYTIIMFILLLRGATGPMKPIRVGKRSDGALEIR